MDTGLSKTLEMLVKSRNEAANDILLPALDSPYRSLREGALHTILRRRSPAGHRELVRRWPTLTDEWKDIVAQYPGQITGVLRDAILSADTAMCECGCEALLHLREYDLIPALINAAEDDANPHAGLAGQTLLRLSQILFEDQAQPRDVRNRRDPHVMRRHAVESLEASVQRFTRHQRREILEAFVLVADRQNATLRRLLQNPHEPSYLPLVDILSHSQQSGVTDLLLDFLDDPHAPSAAVNMVAHRTDEPFIRGLLGKVGAEPSPAVKASLKRMTSIHWLRDDPAILARLNDAEQQAMVNVAVCSGMNRLQAFEVIQTILRRGNVGGRRAASAALAEFRGIEANQLAIERIEDPDPQVRANILLQLRERGIPGAMTQLLESVESPHAVVREAAQKCLAEFNITRYLSAFDMLDEQVRRSTGLLVKKVDPQTVPTLARELAASARTRRLRALHAARVIHASPELEASILALLQDDDHFVRADAAASLGQCDTNASREALRAALVDRSVAVREAAERSLEMLVNVETGKAVSVKSSPVEMIADFPHAAWLENQV